MLFKTNKQTKNSNCQLKILYQWKYFSGMKGKLRHRQLKETKRSICNKTSPKKVAKGNMRNRGKLKKNKFGNPRNEW